MILALGIILGAGLTVFTLENAGPVTVTMLSYSLTAPMALVLVAVIAVSALAAILAVLPTMLRNEKRIKKLEIEKKEVENELAKYHITIPVAPPAPGTRSFVLEQNGEKVYVSK
jgi:uncharacterized integral membrane protein